MKRKITLSLAITLITAIGVFGVGRTRSQDQDQDHEKGAPEVLHHTNPHITGQAAPAGSTRTLTPRIAWHGGPVIAAPTIYLIWYGNWNANNSTDTPGGQQIIRDFASNIGGSSYFNINTTYPGVTNNVTFFSNTNEFNDNYSFGTSLSDANIQAIVNNAIRSKWGTPDASGVYFVLTSSDVNESSGFCTQYCGWHTAGTPSVGHVRYSFVGNAARCLNACAIQTKSPNGNAGVDAMISVIAHELEEATTDPDLNAWFDGRGAENADKCAWTFGSAQYLANGAWANMKLGSRDFLIQRNLNANDNRCYVSWSGGSGVQ